jgi:hypothetical protein
MVDTHRFIAEELKLPDGFILDDADRIPDQLVRRFLDIS